MKQRLKTVITAILSLSMAITVIAPNSLKAASSDRTEVSHVAVHDPSVLYGNDKKFYIFGSNQGAASSVDLMHWESKTKNIYQKETKEELAESFAWAGYQDGSTNAGSGMALWAPCAIYNPYYKNSDGTEGSYMIYYPASSNFKRGCIGYAISKEPDQGYQYVDTIMYSGFTKKGGKDEQACKDSVDTNYQYTNLAKLIDNKTLSFQEEWLTKEGDYNIGSYPQAIDPTVFFDKDNQLWMCYGSHGGGIWLLPLDRTTGEPNFLTKEQVETASNQGQIADAYFGYKLTRDGEGPYLFYDAVSDYYYLTVSYGQISDGYNLRLFRSKTVNGIYKDAKGNQAVYGEGLSQDDVGIKMIGNYQLESTAAYCMAGHNSMIRVDEELFNIYHQRFTGNTSFSTRVHQMFLNEKGWLCTAVYEYAGDNISKTGYDKTELVGSYQFVNHGSISSASQLTVYTIRLNNDGTITGDLEGTWNVKDNSYYMSLTINKITYDGVFFQQQDESEQEHKVMTFTAVGENNETIWGSKMDKESQPELAKEEIQSPAYAYDFSTTDHYLTMNQGSLTAAGVLTGNAAIVNDEQMGLSLLTGDENSFLKVSSDSFYGMTNGFSIGLWAKSEGKGTLFSTVSNAGTISLINDFTENGMVTANVQLGEESYSLFIDDCKWEQWNYLGLTIKKDSIGISVNGAELKEIKVDLSKFLEENNLIKQLITFGGGQSAIDNIEIYALPLASKDYAQKFDIENSWTSNWAIDFGPEGSPQWDNYTMMYHTTSYIDSSVTQNYGFTEIINAYETEAGGAKIRDFVYKAGGEKYTFKIDLPNGEYSVFVYSGNKMAENTLNFYFNEDSQNVHTQITPEGVASDNYGGENTYSVNVTNHILTITFWGDTSLGEDAITGALNSLEITKIEKNDSKEEESESADKTNSKNTLKKPKITKVTSTGKSNNYKIKWKSQKKADNYSIQISNKKSFKTIIYKTTTKASSYILKKKMVNGTKTIYIRVRSSSGSKKNDNKVYSSWSKAVKVTIK